MAVYEAVQEAADRARVGEGPTLLECVTFRYRSHCELEPPDHLRDPDVIVAWKKRDPVDRLEALLLQRGLLDDDGRDSIGATANMQVDDAVQYAEGCAFPPPEEVTADAYAPEDPALVGGRRI
jgi:TPP-dependent pyruvate/acetoin dehydrogenase alpha subunit